MKRRRWITIQCRYIVLKKRLRVNPNTIYFFIFNRFLVTQKTFESFSYTKQCLFFCTMTKCKSIYLVSFWYIDKIFSQSCMRWSCFFTLKFKFWYLRFLLSYMFKKHTSNKLLKYKYFKLKLSISILLIHLSIKTHYKWNKFMLFSQYELVLKLKSM